MEYKLMWTGCVVMGLAWLCIMPEGYPPSFVVGQVVLGLCGLKQSYS